MRLTDIKQTKKGRFSLFFDGEFAFSVPADILAQFDLSTGQQLSGEAVEEIRQETAGLDARRYALRLLSGRSYTAWELHRKLCTRCTPEDARAAVERMQELGLIDDADYAARYARDLVNLGRDSLHQVRRKLLQKGLSEETVEEAMAQFDTLDTTERLRAIVERRYAAALGDEKGYRRTVAALQRLGYSYGDIRTVLREYVASFGEEE